MNALDLAALNPKRPRRICLSLTLACASLHSIIAVATDAKPARTDVWVHVAPSTIAGQGMTPYNSDDIKPFIDRAGPPEKAWHTLAYNGQLLVDVVKTRGTFVHFPNFPNDELILIFEGSLTLTTDITGVQQTFHAGEPVIVKKGWVGLWTVNPGPYREVAIVPSDYFDTSTPPRGMSELTPIAVSESTTDGTHMLYSGNFSVEEQNNAQASQYEVIAPSDEVIKVLAGRLTLKSGTKKEDFKAGDIVVIPNGLTCLADVSAEYRGLVAKAK